MKQTVSKKALTVAELIVVITILAILSTFGFLAYNEYIQKTHATATTKEITSLAKAMDITEAADQNARFLIKHNPKYAVAGTFGSGITLSSWSLGTTGTNYSVGIIESWLVAKLWMKEDGIKDGRENAYIVAATDKISYSGGVMSMFQVTGTIEENNAMNSVIRGRYLQLASSDSIGLIKGIDGTTVAQTNKSVPYCTLPAYTSSLAPSLVGSGQFPDGWCFVYCADAWQTCTIPAGTSGWVVFGGNGSWYTKKIAGSSIPCVPAAFWGSPTGTPNKCAYLQ